MPKNKKSLKSLFPEIAYVYVEADGDSDDVGFLMANDSVEPIAREAASIGGEIVTAVYRLEKIVTVKSQTVVTEVE